MANELGLRILSFKVDDFQGHDDWLATEGYARAGGIGQHEDVWRMDYVRVPRGNYRDLG